MRGLVFEVHPTLLHAEGLVAAVRREAESAAPGRPCTRPRAPARAAHPRSHGRAGALPTGQRGVAQRRQARRTGRRGCRAPAVMSGPAGRSHRHSAGSSRFGSWWWTTTRWCGAVCGPTSTSGTTWTRVGEAGDGVAAMELVRMLADRQQLPDVVLIDLVMRRMDGLATIRAIKQDHPSVEVLVVTSFSETQRIQSALAAGAAGYVLEDADVDEIHRAVVAARRGEVHLDPVVTRKLSRSPAEARVRGADAAGTGDPRADRARAVQPAHRGDAGGRRADRGDARDEHLHEAARGVP